MLVLMARYGNLDAALQDATCKARQSLFRGARVNRRNGAGVTGIQELQEIERLAAANLADQNTIRTMAQSSFQQVADRYGGHAVLFAARFEADEILMGQLNLGGVLDQKNALVRGNELPKRRQEGWFFPILFRQKSTGCVFAGR